jgi:opacity protein-like surface antigen
MVNLGMPARLLMMIVVAVTLSCATAVSAQEIASKFEITPYVAYRVGGSFSEEDGDGRVELNESSAEGIMINFKAKENGQYELLYSRQSTDANTRGFFPNDPVVGIDVEHIQFGGTYLFDGQNTRPFLAMTLGVSRFDPADTASRAKNFFSASLGAGVQLAASSRFGVRLEARAFTTFVDKSNSIFCGSEGGEGSCLILVEGNLLTQWEVRAGLVFRF